MAHVEGDAWHVEEDVELKQSLRQKEAITAQMISIISTRLNSLQAVGDSTHPSFCFCGVERTECVAVLALADRGFFPCHSLANSRKFGLECDLRVNLDYCSKMVRAIRPSTSCIDFHLLHTPR